MFTEDHNYVTANHMALIVINVIIVMRFEIIIVCVYSYSILCCTPSVILKASSFRTYVLGYMINNKIYILIILILTLIRPCADIL